MSDEDDTRWSTYQPLHLQLHQLQGELGSEAGSVKLDWTTQTNKFNHLQQIVDLRLKLTIMIFRKYLIAHPYQPILSSLELNFSNIMYFYLHIVDQRVAMCPGILTMTMKRSLVYLLDATQIIQSQGKGMY